MLLSAAAVGEELLAPPPDRIQSATARISDLPHATGPVEIDGVLDEEIWQRALLIALDVETNPRENEPAGIRTDAYLIEDGDRLLIAFDARDPEPAAIRAYLRDRDTAFSDDRVGVVLDSFNDERRAFQFFVNALGVQMDMTLDDVNGGTNNSWNAIWDSAGVINDRGYVVEMAIPFSQLRFQRGDGPQVWGIDLLRIYPRQNQQRLSNNPQERGRNCYLCQLSKIRGFANAEAGRDLEVVPTLTASRQDRRQDLIAGPLLRGDTETEFGAAVRWGITPDITASLALNPDFSQVEADIPQLDVNNQFALFFPESRPFFLEGANYFATPVQAVFTRTIADPNAAAKLTGQAGNNTYGVFGAEDAVTNLLFPGPLGSSSHSLDQKNTAVVGRYSRGFGDSSTIGALLTSRSGSGYRNRLAGVDGRYRINNSNNLRFQHLWSETEYPDRVATGFGQPLGRFDGDIRRLNYNYNSRNWFANLNYTNTDPGFRADLGFIARVGTEQQNVNFGHIWHGESDDWWNQFRVGANAYRQRESSGRLLARGAESFIILQGPWQSVVQAFAWNGQNYWNNTLYDVRGTFVYGQIRPTRPLQLSLSVNRSEQIDFANSRLGDQVSLQPSLEWNVNRHLLLRVNRTMNRLDAKTGENIFDAELTDLRLTWQFNLRSFLRLTVQRQLVERNPAMYLNGTVDAKSLAMGTQLLYSYKLNPQTVVFAGYSDNHLENDMIVDPVKQDRTFFIKFSYAWIP